MASPQTEMTERELAQQAEIEKLRAENAKLAARAASSKALSLKVSEKGAISVYGMGRFPVTLYRGQMEALLAHKPVILEFIKNHEGELATKE